jgi:RHS repeat-associated protein
MFLYNGEYGVVTDENNLLHMRARFYNPEIKRFVNEDPIQDGLNWYAYAGGNPINRLDPSGESFIKDVFNWAKNLVTSENVSVIKGSADMLMLVPGLGDSVGEVIRANNGFARSWVSEGIFSECGFEKINGSYHASQPDVWQENYGYSSYYDEVFDAGTNIAVEKFPFTGPDGTEYIIGVWKADYLNFGAGAELGIYQKYHPGASNRKTDKVLGAQFDDYHFVNKDLAMPMTIDLSYRGKNIISYSHNNAWWITGFNPEYTNVDPADLTATFTVDFSGHKDLYDAFYKEWNDSKSWSFDHRNHIATFTF